MKKEIFNLFLRLTKKDEFYRIIKIIKKHPKNKNYYCFSFFDYQKLYGNGNYGRSLKAKIRKDLNSISIFKELEENDKPYCLNFITYWTISKDKKTYLLMIESSFLTLVKAFDKIKTNARLYSQEEVNNIIK